MRFPSRMLSFVKAKILPYFRGSPASPSRIALPSDLWSEVFDFVVLIPGSVDGFHTSPINDAKILLSRDKLRARLCESRRTALCASLVCRSWYRLIRDRVYWMMLMIATIGALDNFMMKPSYLRGIRNSRPIGSLVVRFDIYSEYLTQTDLSSFCDALEACTSLRHFYLFVAVGKKEDLVRILEVVSSSCAETLTTFECFLPPVISHLAMSYVPCFRNLAVCAIGTSSFLHNDPRAESRYPPCLVPENARYLTLRNLHTLRIHRADLLDIVRTWEIYNLRELRVDFELEYDVPKTLTPILGSHIDVIDVRYIGPYRKDLLNACPNIREAVFDVRGSMWVIVVPDVPVHANLQKVALRGVVGPRSDSEVRSSETLLYLHFFCAKGVFPKLQVVCLLDFTVSLFMERLWSRYDATKWLDIISRFSAIHVKLVDLNGKPLKGDRMGMEALRILAAGQRRTVLYGLHPDTSDEED